MLTVFRRGTFSRKRTMPEALNLPPVAQGVMAITAVALAVVRLLTASRPFWAWSRVPVWVQKLLPALLMAGAALPTAIEHARSWLDVVVGFVVTGSMWFTASRGDKRPPEDSDGGPRLQRSNTDPKLDDTTRIIPEPTKLSPPDRSRLHNDRPEPPEAAEFRSWDWRPALLLALLLAVVTQPACSAFRDVTPADRAQAYAAQAKAAELACKAYVFDLATERVGEVPAMAKLCAGE
jgi:hypothetical protein